MAKKRKKTAWQQLDLFKDLAPDIHQMLVNEHVIIRTIELKVKVCYEGSDKNKKADS